jgi:CheY-like chemotaxis protein
MAEQQRPDVIFLDVDEPGSRAAEIVALFRNGITRQTPLYLMSGVPPRQGLPEGAAGMLRKPFSIDDMTRIVQSVLRSRNRGQETIPS